MNSTATMVPVRDERELDARAKTATFSNEYPFDPHFLDVDGGTMHYVDEGPKDADPILMVHGNPTWSFYFRNLVKAFSDRARCVAPDHIGCGLSDKPQDWSYRLEAHIANLERLVLELDLRDITLCLHDWGGAIGFGLARRHPDRIKRVIVMNTAAFLSKRIPLRISVCRIPLLGEFFIRHLNAFAEAATTMAVVDNQRMTRLVRRGYLAPYDNYDNRIATWAFVKDIPLKESHPSYATLKEIDESLEQFKQTPMCVIWGDRDFCFSPHFREIWQQRFPDARVHASPNAGHYVLEDAREDAIRWIAEFLDES